ncbi:hypothetical protein F5Y04DRAFT_259368 [Hypomontagnella monticulosa]|nr:hypothetical protein F5Y04DRAFT_259368 [Hypomontagnella monticulosa]
MASTRLAPCRTLLQHSVPSVVWFEDAIGRYGVPTVVFDLHLLVPDINLAHSILCREGWVPVEPEPLSYLASTRSLGFRRLLAPPIERPPSLTDEPIWPPPPPDAQPRSERVATVLFEAVEWGVTVDILTNASDVTFLPPLPIVIDALIDALLDAPLESGLRWQVATMMAYLYEHASELKDRKFANWLDPMHRQFHTDCVSGQMSCLWAIPFIRYERRVRDATRRGEYEVWGREAVSTKEKVHLVRRKSFGGWPGKKME